VRARALERPVVKNAHSIRPRAKRGRKAEADYGGLSQYEIARRLGLSRARVSQIEAQAMRKLRAMLDAPDDCAEREREQSNDRADAKPDDDDGRGEVERMPEHPDPES